MYAVVGISGKQYKISPGQKLFVDAMGGKAGELVLFDQVLLMEENGKIYVGTPTVKNSWVKARIIGNIKERKIDVSRFKAKVRVRRSTGFRAQSSLLEIISIGRT